MYDKIFRYYHTLKHLKWIQVKYQLLYRFEKIGIKLFFFTKRLKEKPSPKGLEMQESIESNLSWKGHNSFTFLNLDHHFENEINWNFGAHGKLWAYNLNYFEYLSQPGISKSEGLNLIHDFIEHQASNRDGMEPFPVSLRIISWIKFINKHQIQNTAIDDSLFNQLEYLYRHPEYHLLGNHLLENGFALLFGGCYFNEQKVLQLSQKILATQLKEQILKDGAHFELSPMYHQIMLFRILDSINLLQNNPAKIKENLLQLLQQKSALMLSWMSKMTFANGDMAHVNDSVAQIAPSARVLSIYAKRLAIEALDVPLKESGYRKFYKPKYEILIDVGNVGPDYIPGHAHSDTLSFVLYYENQPIIVDTGISTYEKNERRSLERSTVSHNTVMIEEQEQSEVWGGFRVARRARIIELDEKNNQLQASHDGYKRLNVIHKRKFIMNESSVQVTDSIYSDKEVKAFFHFHPTIQVEVKNNEIQTSFGRVVFSNSIKIELLPYTYALGFNQTEKAVKVEVTFKKTLQSNIILT